MSPHLFLAGIAVQGIPATDVTFGQFLFNREIKIGDLLTPISLLIGAATFVWTLRKDIQSRQGVEADRVRAAGAKALAKLQRWRDLTLRYYHDVQPTFVEVSDQLGADFDVAKARDHLWAALTAARIKSAERLLEESLETAYVELSSHYPGIYIPFRAAVEAMKVIDEDRHGDHLSLSQDAIMHYRNRQQGYMPPMLGNDLRGCTNAITALLSEQLQAASLPMETFLTSIISQTDRQLLKSKRTPAQISKPPERYADIREVWSRRATPQSSQGSTA